MEPPDGFMPAGGASSALPHPSTTNHITQLDPKSFPPLANKSGPQQVASNPPKPTATNSQNPETSFATMAANSKTQVTKSKSVPISSKFARHNGLPAVIFDDMDYYGSLAQNCSNILVGKFMKTMPPIDEIRKALPRKFKFRGKIFVGVIDGRTASLEFSDEEDYKFIYFKRAIELLGCTMWVQKWSPDFTPGEDHHLAPLWVNLPGLPLHLFNWEALKIITAQVGTPLEMDNATRNRTRPSMAKVRIEVDLSKPVVRNIWIGTEGKNTPLRGFVQKLEYDFVPEFCTNCRLIGHTFAKCYRAARNRNATADVASKEKTKQGGGKNDSNSSNHVPESQNEEEPVEQSVGKCGIGGERTQDKFPGVVDMEEVIPETSLSNEAQQETLPEVQQLQEAQLESQLKDEEAPKEKVQEHVSDSSGTKLRKKKLRWSRKRVIKPKKKDKALVLKKPSKDERKEKSKQLLLEPKKKIAKNTKGRKTGLLLEYASGHKEKPKLTKKKKKNGRKVKEKEKVPPNLDAQTFQYQGETSNAMHPCLECCENISIPSNSTFCKNLEEKKESWKQRLLRKTKKNFEEKECSDDESEDSEEWKSEDSNGEEDEIEGQEIGDEPDEDLEEVGQVGSLSFGNGMEICILGEEATDGVKHSIDCNLEEGELEEGYWSEGEETAKCLLKAFGLSQEQEESEDEVDDEVAQQFGEAIRNGSLSPRGINDSYSTPFTRSRARALKVDVRNSPYV